MPSSKSLVSPRVILSLLYAMLAIISTFLGGSKAFMLMGALCADLLALLVANVVWHAAPGRRGKEGMALANALAMLFGGFFIMLAFYMTGAVFTSNIAGNGSDEEALVNQFMENALPMLLVLGSAGVAYWLDLKEKSLVTSSEQAAFSAVRYRMRFMQVWVVVFIFGVGFGYGTGRLEVFVFALFLLRALMEWFGRTYWRKKKPQT